MRSAMSSTRLTILCVLALGLLVAHPQVEAASTADPARVLVIYNSNWTGDEDGDGVQDSLEVAQYYMAKRGVPAANLLGLATNDAWYDTSTYAALHSDVITPIKNKLAALGATNIDVLLMCYRTPLEYGQYSFSFDNMLMGLNSWSTTNDNVTYAENPYLESTPGIGSDHGGFNHASYQLNGTNMYLVCRLDGSSGVTGCLDLVDQALYGERYISNQPGYYGGNIYIDSRGDKGTYTDASLTADADVQSGQFGYYAGADVNIAYGEHYAAASGFPLKWEKSGGTIGDPGLTFQDGSDATSAPRALMYGGWYNLGRYKKVFDWIPGSVACDLNSTSFGGYYWLRDPFSLAWGRGALSAGATCVCGVSGEPYVGGHTRPNILIYYMLNGYSFAEASGAANPGIGWMSYAIGDPLYRPTKPKTAVIDTQAPGFVGGVPTYVWTKALGSAVKILVADAPEPDLAKARIDFGATTAYGQNFSSVGSFRHHLLQFPELPSATLIHYRVTLTDPVGNASSTGDLTFTTPAQTPYGGIAASIPGTVECENFDEGGEDIAYHDRDPRNYVSYQYRGDTGVEINTQSPYYLFNGSFAGEWLEYTVQVTQTGTYTIDEAVADGAGGMFHIEFDGVDKTGPLTVSTAAGWTLLTQTGVSLTAGTHIMRIAMDPGVEPHIGSFDYVRFTRTGGTSGDTTPPVISGIAVGSITISGATVTWTTDEASDSQVQYGTTTSYGNVSTLNTALVSAHSVTLAGLAAGTTYHLRVLSRDAAGNLAASGDVTFTTSAPSDTTPPVISAITAGSITTTSATITWTTNEASDSQVQYGTTTSYGSSSTLNTTLVTSHSVSLSGLTASSLYHYRVLSRDAAGNLATSGDNTFTTSAQPDTTPPVISAVSAGSVTASAAVITWTTNEPADSRVQYGTTTAYGSQTALNGTKVISHSMALSGLTASTLYHVRVLSTDAAGNPATSGDVTFTTTSTPDTTPPVISGMAPGSVNTTGAIIAWSTNEPSDSQVQYGLTTAYGSTTALDASMVTAHSVALTGLTASTVYHMRVLSRDAAGNLSTSSDITFTTSAVGTSSTQSNPTDENGRSEPVKQCGVGTGGLAVLAIGLMFFRRRDATRQRA